MIEPVHDHVSVNAVAATSVCGPDPRMDPPTRDWTLDELYQRALWESRQIHTCERCCPRYWHFGIVMRLVQAQVRPGRWMEWCLENHIQRDRWKRGRLFAMAFKTADELRELTIAEAEELARQILGLARRKSAADARLRRSLTAMEKTLTKRLDEGSALTNTRGLRPRIAQIQRMLAELDAACAAHERHSAVPAQKRRKKPR